MSLLVELAKFCSKHFKSRCFISGRSILIRGDCYDVVDSIADRFGTIADCWINDPPYGTTANAWDNVIPADDYWGFAESITKPTAPLIIFGSQPFTSAVVMSADAWHRYCLVWDKNKCGSPGLAKYRPMKTHEDIMVFSRKVHPYYPQMEAGDPYYRKTVGRSGPNNHKYGFSGHGETKNIGTRYPKSILHFPRNFSAQQQVHPTQKPVPLLDWLLRSYTKPGDLTVDITAGSCTLAIAAFGLRRACLCIEREKKYFQLSKTWLGTLRSGGDWNPAAYRSAYLSE